MNIKQGQKNLTCLNGVKVYRIKVAGRLLGNGTKNTKAEKMNNLKVNIKFKV